MVTLLYLKNWAKCALVTAAAVLLELAFLHDRMWWLVGALALTALVFVAVTAALVSDWRLQRGSALYRFDTVNDVTSKDRW